MITLDSVTLTFPDGASRIRAVDDVSITVRPGTIMGLTGPSGSGKSSLLAVAATLIRPDSGTVVIDDVDTATLDLAGAAKLRRERIGLIFQQSNLLPSLTAREQLTVMNELGGNRGARTEVAARADELLDRVGLADHRHKRPHQLSGGQRQRVNIARALTNDPSVLIVDEPTSALDSERSQQIMELLVELTTGSSIATLLVTHDLSLTPHLHTMLYMKDGRLTNHL
ncbi:ABC transporter ATP-binding protein [Microbacterium sp. ZW T5_56]|uniref:ABC transporter ATP-binding protein n=1 Tax=Microbacterium sp. ZW T5_56 TaxID=3378081 RepID=UPI0038526055